MATRRQATVGGVHEALEVLEKNKSVVCGIIIGLTKTHQVECVTVQCGPVKEHAVGLAGVLRALANDLDPPS